MLEYSANAAVKAKFAQAHEARGAVLKQAWAWLTARRRPQAGFRTGVSRWA